MSHWITMVWSTGKLDSDVDIRYKLKNIMGVIVDLAMHSGMDDSVQTSVLLRSQLYSQQIRDARDVVWQFSRRSDDLRPWYW